MQHARAWTLTPKHRVLSPSVWPPQQDTWEGIVSCGSQGRACPYPTVFHPYGDFQAHPSKLNNASLGWDMGSPDLDTQIGSASNSMALSVLLGQSPRGVLDLPKYGAMDMPGGRTPEMVLGNKGAHGLISPSVSSRSWGHRELEAWGGGAFHAGCFYIFKSTLNCFHGDIS